MNKIQRCRRLAVLVLAAVLVGGCHPGSTVETLPERHGVVAVQVTNNTDRLTRQIQTWTAVHVVDLDHTDQVHRLRPSGTGLIGSRVFVGALPPGRYAIFNFHAHARLGDANFWLNAPVPRSLGTFQVDDGHLSSLGTLVYQPLGEAEIEGREQMLYVITRIDEDESLADFVVASFPELAQSIGAAEVGWDPDGMEHYRKEMAERVRDHAIGTQYHRLDDGRVAMTGPMGMVLVRNFVADWQHVETGVSVQLAALTRHRDFYLAGGERGTMLAAERLDGPWWPLPGPGLMEAVFWLHGMADGSVFALTRAADVVRFYRLGPDLAAWDSLVEFQYTQRQFFTGRGQVHAVALDGDRIAVFGDGRRIVVAGDGTVESDEENMHLYEFQAQSDGVLIAFPGSLWSGISRLRYSRDDGKSWQSLRAPGAGEREHHLSRYFHYILPEGGSLAFTHRGRRDGDRRRILYDDLPRLRRAAADGSLLGWGEEVEMQCTGLLPSISTEQRLFSRCEDGRLLVSEDQGATWQVDFNPGQDAAGAMEAADTI